MAMSRFFMARNDAQHFLAAKRPASLSPGFRRLTLGFDSTLASGFELVHLNYHSGQPQGPSGPAARAALSKLLPWVLAAGKRVQIRSDTNPWRAEDCAPHLHFSIRASPVAKMVSRGSAVQALRVGKPQRPPGRRWGQRVPPVGSGLPAGLPFWASTCKRRSISAVSCSVSWRRRVGS